MFSFLKKIHLSPKEMTPTPPCLEKCNVDKFHPIFSGCASALTPIRVLKVYDGDTLTKCYFHLFNDEKMPVCNFPIRLHGINAAELKGTSGVEHDLASKAKKYVESRVLNKDDVYAYFIDEDEKYGRLLAYIISGYSFNEVSNKTKEELWNISINKILVDMECAKLYDGGKKELVST